MRWIWFGAGVVVAAVWALSDMRGIPWLVDEGLLASDEDSKNKQRFVFALLSVPALLGCIIAMIKWDNTEIMEPLRKKVGAAWLTFFTVGIISVSLDISDLPTEFAAFFAVLITVSALLGVIQSLLEWVSQSIAAYFQKQLGGRTAHQSE